LLCFGFCFLFFFFAFFLFRFLFCCFFVFFGFFFIFFFFFFVFSFFSSVLFFYFFFFFFCLYSFCFFCSDAAADDHRFVRGQRQRFTEHGKDALRCSGRLLLLGELFEQHHELVTAESGDRVSGASAAPKAFGHRHQHAVPDVVPQRVVDQLEPVQVEDQHCDVARLALQALLGVTEPVDEQCPVGQPRQGVGQGEALELCLGLPAFADVAGRGLHPDDVAVDGVPHRVRVRFEPHPGAVGTLTSEGHSFGDAPGSRGVRLVHRGGVIGMGADRDLGSDDVVRRQAQDPLVGWTDVEQGSVQVHVADDVAAVLREQPVPRLRRSQLLLHDDPGGDVGLDADVVRQLAVRVEHRAQRELVPERGTVLAVVEQGDRDVLTAGETLPQEGDVGRVGARALQESAVLPDGLRLGESGHRCEGRVHPEQGDVLGPGVCHGERHPCGEHCTILDVQLERQVPSAAGVGQHLPLPQGQEHDQRMAVQPRCAGHRQSDHPQRLADVPQVAGAGGGDALTEDGQPPGDAGQGVRAVRQLAGGVHVPQGRRIGPGVGGRWQQHAGGQLHGHGIGVDHHLRDDVDQQHRRGGLRGQADRQLDASRLLGGQHPSPPPWSAAAGRCSSARSPTVRHHTTRGRGKGAAWRRPVKRADVVAASGTNPRLGATARCRSRTRARTRMPRAWRAHSSGPHCAARFPQLARRPGRLLRRARIPLWSVVPEEIGRAGRGRRSARPPGAQRHATAGLGARGPGRPRSCTEVASWRGGAPQPGRWPTAIRQLPGVAMSAPAAV
jgi:hypothetical protein